MVDDPMSSAPNASDGAAVTPPPRRIGHDPASTAIGIGVSILASILGLIVLAWAILFITKGRFLKPTFEKYATRSAGRPVRVAGDFQLYFAPIDIKFLAEGLTVANPKWATRPNFLDARLIDTRIATFPLIFGRQRVNWLNLVGASIDTEWDAQGRRNTWTFGDPNVKGEPFELPEIRRAIVSGTTLRYRDPVLRFLTDVKFDTIKAKDTSVDNNIRFTGDGTLRAKPFNMYGSLLSANEVLAGGRNRFELHASAVGQTRLDISGTLAGATQLEGADLTMLVRGRNLRDLFDFINVAVPDTRSYRLRSKLTKAGEEWRFTRMNGGFGDSDVAGKMTISMPRNRLMIVADISSRKVDIVDVGPFVGYEPNALATKGVMAAVGQTGGAPRILPDAPLRMESIKAFDAHVDYKVATIRAPNLPVSNIALTLDLDRALMKLSPLTMDMAGGHLSSDISVNARVPSVITDYDIRLSPTPMGKLLKGWGVEESGTTGTVKARIQMKGTGDTVRESLASSDGRIAIILPKGSFWTRNVQLAEFDIGTFVHKMFQDKLKKPVDLNCGLIGFTVRNGIAAADPILIDTDKNVMTATGGFSFRDESIDVRFRADAKKFSLFSGQSPVRINGHFAAPAIQIISPELLARGGAGLALGVVASPLAAVLAFVDVGDAKDAACGPVLAGARASGQRTAGGEPRKDLGTRGANAKKAAGQEEKKKKFLGIF
jgi:uncharacterized protein involved in outer membrane biogenesis